MNKRGNETCLPADLAILSRKVAVSIIQGWGDKRKQPLAWLSALQKADAAMTGF